MITLSLFLYISSIAVAVRRDKSILYARSFIAVIICSLIINYDNYHVNFLNSDIGIFHGLLHINAVISLFHMFILVMSAAIMQLYSFYPRKISCDNFTNPISLLTFKLLYFNSFILNKVSEQFKVLEYSLLILFVILGGVFITSSSDLISMFLSIELQSYGLYILCSVYKDSEKATSGGLTYFLLGGLSSCFILFASSLIYGNIGDTGFDSMYILCSIYEPNGIDMNNNIINYSSSYINLALAIMSIGFLFKVTAAPFHFWSPDVYDAIPTTVTTFVAIFAKITLFIFILEIIYYTNSSHSYNDNYMDSWKFTLLMSSLFSFVIGSLLGMVQFRIKRLYAYSTISHVGFILLGLSINSIESIQSFMFYLMQYSLSNLNAFFLLIAMGYTLYLYVEKDNANSTNITDTKNSPIQLISQLTGFFYINPAIALSFGITIFSFVGIPPLVGFFGKQMVISSALDNGYIFITLIAILTSVVSAYYYLSLIKQIFFSKSNFIKNPSLKDTIIKCNMQKLNNSNSASRNTISINSDNIVLSSYISLTISIITLVMLLFIINPQEWLSLINILSVSLFNN